MKKIFINIILIIIICILCTACVPDSKAESHYGGEINLLNTGAENFYSMNFNGGIIDGGNIFIVDFSKSTYRLENGKLYVQGSGGAPKIKINNKVTDFTLQLDVSGCSYLLPGYPKLDIFYGLPEVDSNYNINNIYNCSIIVDMVEVSRFTGNSYVKLPIIDSYRKVFLGLETFWCLSENDHLGDKCKPNDLLKFGQRVVTYKFVVEGDKFYLYYKNNIDGAGDFMFNVIRGVWEMESEIEGFVNILFNETHDYILDNIYFAPAANAIF